MEYESRTLESRTLGRTLECQVLEGRTPPVRVLEGQVFEGKTYRGRILYSRTLPEEEK